MDGLMQLVEALGKTAVSCPNLLNPYASPSPHADSRRHNLYHYLQYMHAQSPTLLLVGEAPGYRGCRLTGIPFTSPQTLQAFLQPRIPQLRMIDEWPKIQREATATIMWECLENGRFLPLLWNTLPFHPHQPGHPQSNRTPTNKELEYGRIFLHHLRHLFPTIKTIAAIGKKAHTTLTHWQLPAQYIRHPSHGGKTNFRTKLIPLLHQHNKPPTPD
ncbi:MAG: uracil-DNA glycosylase [Chloroflexi bacterium]|nr:MAG: uracil-DNA glycosylase [Chloroflexota bacterium]